MSETSRKRNSEVAIKSDDPPKKVGIDPREVQGRRDLLVYLNQSLTSKYKFDQGDDGIRQVATYLKSYLIEIARADEALDTQKWMNALTSVTRTREPDLYLGLDRRNSPVFIDCADPRFCLVHSIAKTEISDSIIHKVTDGMGVGLDRAWMPTQFLLDQKIGQLRGFKFSHQAVDVSYSGRDIEEPIESEDVEIENDLLELERATNPIAVETSDEFVVSESLVQKRDLKKMRFEISDHNNAASLYQRIRNSEIAGGKQALDWIQYTATHQNGLSITHGVYSDGKIVANGTSVALHLEASRRLRSNYASVIRTIESTYSIGWTREDTSKRLRGEPMIFRFPEQFLISDLRGFALSVFQVARPFRLLGLFQERSDNRIDIDAVDLHTGDPFSVELTKTWMRIYLPIGSCGNVIARLFRNLQHAIDSDVSLLNAAEADIFQVTAAQ